MRLLQASVIFAVAIVGLVNPAWGFVELDHAEPRVGSVVRAVPEAVTLFSPNQFVLAACPLQSTMKTLLELMLAGSIKTLRILNAARSGLRT